MYLNKFLISEVLNFLLATIIFIYSSLYTFNYNYQHTNKHQYKTTSDSLNKYTQKREKLFVLLSSYTTKIQNLKL